MGTGAVAAGIGAGFVGTYFARGPTLQQEINQGLYDVPEATRRRDGLYRDGTLGAVLVGAGLTVLAAGILWSLLSRYGAP
jgi:hypothetical protein